MLEGGADIRYIQAMLGHAELSTTQIYTQVSIRALQAVHAATFPGASNVPRTARDDDAESDSADPFNSPPSGPSTGVVERVSPQQLLAALDQEIEEENRPPTGSPADSSTDSSTAPEGDAS